MLQQTLALLHIAPGSRGSLVVLCFGHIILKPLSFLPRVYVLLISGHELSCREQYRDTATRHRLTVSVLEFRPTRVFRSGSPAATGLGTATRGCFVKFIPAKLVNPVWLFRSSCSSVCFGAHRYLDGAEPVLRECQCGQRFERWLAGPSVEDHSTRGRGSHRWDPAEPSCTWRRGRTAVPSPPTSRGRHRLASSFFPIPSGEQRSSTSNWSANGSYVDVNGFDMTSPGRGITS